LSAEAGFFNSKGMAKTKEQKKEIIKNLEQGLEKQKAIFLIDFRNSKAKDFFELRKKLKEAKSLLCVAKKRLIEIAFKNKGIPIDLASMQGQIALVFGFEDELLPAKIIYQFGKKNDSPEILGGYFENSFVDRERVIRLAQLPSRDELMIGLVRSLNSPAFNLANILKGNVKGLLSALSNIGK